MEVKNAVAAAKLYLQDVFADEKIEDLGLEEIYFDEMTGEWRITLGFSRPWNISRLSALERAVNPAKALQERPTRDYRVVAVRDSDGKVLSIKLHDIAA